MGMPGIGAVQARSQPMGWTKYVWTEEEKLAVKNHEGDSVE